MITTTVQFKNPNTWISNMEEFYAEFLKILGPDLFNEMTYVKTDAILDGHIEEVFVQEWNNEEKAAIITYFHVDNDAMKEFVISHTENPLSRKAEQLMIAAGWAPGLSNGTAVVFPPQARITQINEWSLEIIRPERRQEVLDKYST